MVAHHLELGEVAPRPPHRIQIVQSDAGLGDDQGVRRGFHPPRGDVRLKIRDGGNGEVDIPAPSCGNGVPAQPGMTVPLEEPEECLPHLIDGIGPVREPAVQEGVFLAGSITTVLLVRILAPVELTAARAGVLSEIVVPEEREIEPGHGLGEIKQVLKV